MWSSASLALAATAVVALGGGAAAAQERAPDARGQLAELARVLGESHALRQTCFGAADQYWRSRMKRLLDIEAPDERLKTRLSEAFNAGYGAGRALYPACSPTARQEARRLAGMGHVLAEALAGP